MTCLSLTRSGRFSESCHDAEQEVFQSYRCVGSPEWGPTSLHGESLPVGGIFLNRAAVMCLTVVLFLETQRRMAVQRVHIMTLEITASLNDDLTVNPPALAA